MYPPESRPQAEVSAEPPRNGSAANFDNRGGGR